MKNVIVTGWPLKEKILSNESGLRTIAGTPSSQISINYLLFISNYYTAGGQTLAIRSVQLHGQF